MTITPDAPGPMRVAIIGAAAGIAGQHLQALSQLPAVQIVGMADIAAERVAARAAEHGCPWYTDHQQLLAEVRADIVVICTPHPLHAALAIDALRAGAHVLVEKPLAVTVAEGDAIVAAADAAGRVVAVNFQQRFRPAIERARAMVVGGELGALVRVLCVEPWYRTQAYYASASWRGTWRGEGGGVLMNQAPHPLDLLCHLAGQPTLVWGRARTLGHQIETEDMAHAMLEYAGGVPGYLYFSTVEAGLPRRMELVGDRAALEIVEDRVTLHRFTPALSEHRASSSELFGRPTTAVEVLDLPGDGGGHLAVYRDLLDALATGRRPRCDAREALMSLELANAVIGSAVLGVPLALPLDRARYDAVLAGLRAGTSALPSDR